MKNNYRLYVTAVFVATSLTFTTPISANTGKNPETSIEFKHVGSSSNQPVFELKLNNQEEDVYVVSFKDDKGNILYTEKFAGVNIFKKFSFDKDELGDSNLKLEVKSLTTRKSEVFTINQVRTVIEETVVSRVK